MPSNDSRIDDYIERSADFARPVLEHLRTLIHKAHPEITESIKWGMPSFEYKGLVCGFAAFKNHCTFGFWKQKLMDQGAFDQDRNAMGSFGRITSLKDLPSDKMMITLIRHAIELNENNIRAPKRTALPKKQLVIPDGLKKALAKNKKAKEVFANFSYSHRKDYIEWIDEAKTDSTREKRIAAAIEWVSEGKGRNWKYERK